MCGIAGVIGHTPPAADAQDRALHTLQHRGPDGFGRWTGRLRDDSVTLLHTRLAIIDLDQRSAQPFAADDCVLAYNGEIYNFPELRQELEALGQQFSTSSDTEVVLRAYRVWGPDCVSRFEGMWALALVDLREQRIWMSRDRFGEKPLFVAHWDNRLYFASEVKSLSALANRKPAVNPRQLQRYLVNGYKSLWKQQETFWQDVEEFPAGCSAVFSDAASYRPIPYWKLSYAPVAMTRAEAVAGAADHLSEAVRLCLRSDVRLAFCLSGGIDSGALASIAARKFNRDIQTFSIVDTDERYDESDNIKSVVAALGCRNTVIHTSREGFIDRLQRQVIAHDAPVATISYYIHDFLSESIGASGYKVAISGTGADEIFTGYYDHYAFWLATQRDRHDFEDLLKDWRDGFGKFVRNPHLQNPRVFIETPSERRHIYLDRGIFNDLMIAPLSEDFCEQSYASDALRSRMLNEIFHESVPVMLHEDDLNSMSHSVENRSPFLNRALVEFMYQVPTQHLVDAGYTKSLLRDSVAGFLPDPVRLDRRKKGFNASITSLIDTTDSATRDWILDSSSAIFDYIAHDRFVAFLDGDFDSSARSKFLFSFLSAKAFLDSPLALGTPQTLIGDAA